jgi:hypothetical protein
LVPVPTPTIERITVLVPIPVPAIEILWIRLRCRLGIQIMKGIFQPKKKFCTKSCLFDVNRGSFVDKKHNFILCLWELLRLFYYSSGTVIKYGFGSIWTKYSSGSGQKLRFLRFWFRFRNTEKMSASPFGKRWYLVISQFKVKRGWLPRSDVETYRPPPFELPFVLIGHYL